MVWWTRYIYLMTRRLILAFWELKYVRVILKKQENGIKFHINESKYKVKRKNVHLVIL